MVFTAIFELEILAASLSIRGKRGGRVGKRCSEWWWRVRRRHDVLGPDLVQSFCELQAWKKERKKRKNNRGMVEYGYGYGQEYMYQSNNSGPIQM